MTAIRKFQKKLAREYLDALEYHPTYFHGNPLQPVVQVVTNPDGVMIVGAYPTAEFAAIDGVQKAFCLPHPGIVMRPGNNWGAHLRQVLPGMRKHLSSI